jgi:hypothetical protein
MHIENLLKNYEITNNKEDFVLSTDLQEWVKDKGITTKTGKIKSNNITKLGRDINKYAEINKMTNVGTKVKKIAGKSTNVWIGIKMI